MSGTQNPSISYHRMSVAEKQAYARTNAREPAVTCPACETQTTAADLLAHLETRCQGPREPGPGSRWVTWSQVMAMGAKRSTMNWWVERGMVRFRGDLQARQYLLRDVVLRVAICRQRREFRKMNLRDTEQI